jgi:3-oxoacyl-[acyl-carrier protein] reductase
VRAEGGTAALPQGDVTDHADMAPIIEAHIRTFGRPDVPISNAGDVGRRSPFGELSQRLIDCIIALSARSVVTACRLTVSGFITGATIDVNGGAYLS